MHCILVIEDEDAIRSSLSQILTEIGYEVKTAGDGEKGIEVFQEMDACHMVITDIHMPGMNGNEVASFIRTSKNPSVPVLAITGFPNDIQKGLFDFSITKPFRLKELLDAIRLFEEKQ